MYPSAMDSLRRYIVVGSFFSVLVGCIPNSHAQLPCQCINASNVTGYPASALTTPCGIGSNGPCFVNTFPLTCCVCNETKRPSMMECRALSNMWNTLNSPTCALEDGLFLLLPASSSRLGLCGNLTTCNLATEFEVLPPTPTSDRVCGTFSTCGNGTYPAALPTATSDRVCQRLRTCSPSLEYTVHHATPTTDRVCAPITTCQVPFAYQLAPATATADTQCYATSMCNASQYVVVRPSPTSDTVCAATSTCEWYEYEVAPPIPGLSNALCAPQSRPCEMVGGDDLLFEVVPPSATTDRVCGTVTPHGTCPRHMYRLNATVCAIYTSCSEVDNRITPGQSQSPALRAGAEYVYQAQNATATSNAVCLPTTPCNTTAFEASPPTETTDRTCVQIQRCVSTQYVEQAPTATSNTGCRALASCDVAEFAAISAVPGLTNTVCVPRHACGASAYMEIAATSTSDCVCANVTPCTPTSLFQVRPATLTSDTICAPTRAECDALSFEVVGPTPTGNRVCYPVSPGCIPVLEIEEAANTATTDRLCLPVFVDCSENKSFEVRPATVSTIRTCQALTDCASHEIQVQAPTSSTNRKCDTSSAKHKQIVIGSATGIMTFLVSVMVGLVVLRQWRKERRLAATHDFNVELEAVEAQGILAPDRCFVKNSLVGFRYVPQELDTSKLVCLNTICGSKFTDVSNGTYTPVVGEQGTKVVLKTVRLAHTGIGGRAMGKGLHRQSYDNGTADERWDASGIHDAKHGLFKEAAILAQFQHANVVALVGVVTVDGNAVLVQEDCSEGALDQLLARMYKTLHPIGTLNHNSGLRVALDIALALEYLQTKGYVHKDVCAHNVLVTKDLVYKLTDFGMSEYIRTRQRSRGSDLNDLDAVIQMDTMSSHDSRHAVRWCAPEAIQSGMYTHASDVWAYGIFLYEVYTWAKQPYKGLLGAADVLRFLESGKRLPTPFPRDCTHGTFLFSRIMMCCWHSDAELRPSFASIVSTLKGHLQASKEAAEERHNRRESRVRSRTIRKVLAVKRNDDKKLLRRDTSGSDIYSGEGSPSPLAGPARLDPDEILPRQRSIDELRQQTLCFDDGNMSQNELTPLSSVLDLRVATSPGSRHSSHASSPMADGPAWAHDDLQEKLLVIDTDAGGTSGSLRTTPHRILVSDWNPNAGNCSATSADEEGGGSRDNQRRLRRDSDSDVEQRVFTPSMFLGGSANPTNAPPVRTLSLTIDNRADASSSDTDADGKSAVEYGLNRTSMAAMAAMSVIHENTSPNAIQEHSFDDSLYESSLDTEVFIC